MKESSRCENTYWNLFNLLAKIVAIGFVITGIVYFIAIFFELSGHSQWFNESEIFPVIDIVIASFLVIF